MTTATTSHLLQRPWQQATLQTSGPVEPATLPRRWQRASSKLHSSGAWSSTSPRCRRCAHRPTLSSPCLLLFCPHSSCCALLWGRRMCTASLVEFYVGPLCGHLDQMAVGWGFEALIGRHLFFQSPQMPLQTCTWPFSRVPMPILQPISSKSVGDMVPAPPLAVAAPTGPPSPAPVCCSSAPILPAVHSCGGSVCALRVWWSFMSGRSVAILTRWLSGGVLRP